MISATLPRQLALPAAQAAPAASSIRPMVGLVGIFIAAMMAGLNNRVGALALADVRGALGFGLDDASWISTAYTAGELIAMPFAAWFAITLSLRRFHGWMVATCASLAVLMPFVEDLQLLLLLRFLQGVGSGTLIPILMMAALKFLPPPIRLHGLALYAMTATFAPNLATWLAGQWTDGLADWRWVYWQIVPVAIVATLLVNWGIPRDVIQMDRFKQANWLGMAIGVPALCLITIALDQGVRLDWFNSPWIAVAMPAGLALLLVYLVTEWYHPAPFIKLQILRRRNLALGCILFVLLLVILLSGSLLPASYLARVQDYRALQAAPIGLIVALPQLVLGSVVAMFLYRKWVDARLVFALGLALIALSCLLGSRLTVDWNWEQFIVAQSLQAFGQPMAVVSLLFLMTSVVQPEEGPYISGTINSLRAFGSLLGSAWIGQFTTARDRFHAEMLLDHAGLVSTSLAISPESSRLVAIIGQQSFVLSLADAYRVLGVLALLSIPLVLRLAHVPAPDLSAAAPNAPASPTSRGYATMALPKTAKIVSAALLLAVAIGGALYLNRPASSASTQSTDDAYVQADFTTVAPQVAGTVDKVLIEDNQPVASGDLLATIDDRDFVVAVNAAKAQVEAAQAHVAGLEARLLLQAAAIRQAQAAVHADDASLKLARSNRARYRNLAADGSGSLQALQQAEAKLSIQLAEGDKSLAGLEAARQQTEVLKADLERARAAVAQAQSAQAAAELQLSYTRITAPIDGTVGQRSVRVGAFVNAGKPLLAIVPLDAVYIVANFRETQLARVQAGDPVDIAVDALPGEVLKGTVDSLGPASGVSYSAIAPHNATGNFTKIVQRLPVRISIDPGQATAAKLRVGMSVRPKIRVGKPSPRVPLPHTLG